MAERSPDFNFTEFEPRWQAWWKEHGTFEASDHSEKPKYYLLDMFPYPSGAGLHAGHVENFAGSDVLGRFKLAQGRNVLHPMGWDAFGLPAEQYAAKTGTHPAITTRTNIDNFRRQIQAIGLAIDWSREVNTTDPGYFRWTQWIFLKLFQKGLAYVDERPVNWCPALGTVLANEEVIDGKSEVGGHPVERRNLRQWVLRITAYAGKLLDGLDDLDWPESTKSMQRNWIGRSTGAEVRFDLADHPESLTVYTTRPDTLFGATYMVLAPEHPLVSKITTPDQKTTVDAYIQASAAKSDLLRTDLAKEKTGVFSGSFAINPVTGKQVPIWIADYVLMSYGTGAIMAVPAHDERDFEFATTFDLPIVRVIDKRDSEGNPVELPFTDIGTLMNSGTYDGMDSTAAKAAIIENLEKEQRGTAATNFKLRDWLFSRQRYWGEPFPIVWVDSEGYQEICTANSPILEWLPEIPVSYSDGDRELFAIPVLPGQLPVALPEIGTYEPAGTGESPLAKATDWIEVRIDPLSGTVNPANRATEGIPGYRETNTMPQWAGSCWYYLRYLDPKNENCLVDPSILDYWRSPDFYMGGAEHAVLHLLYARFWHRFLYDCGILNEPEPFQRLFHQGIILGEDGEKMSKSRGNVVNPDEFIASHGADSLRLYLMFMGPLEDKKPWKTNGIEGVHRFLRKAWRELVGPDGQASPKISRKPDEPSLQRVHHESIRKVTGDFESLRFNTAISQLMIFLNAIAKAETVERQTVRDFIRLLAPLAPHTAEELWARMGETPSVVHAGWPEFDPEVLVEDSVTIGLLVNGKPRAELNLPKEANQETALQLANDIERFRAYTEGKTIRKVIYVPGKILNVVVSG